MPKYVKPIRPTPNRADSLWRGVLFAMAPGWTRGLAVQPAPGALAETDDRWRARGTWLNSPTSANYGVKDLGRNIRSDTVGGTESTDQVLFDNINDRFHPTTSQLTVAVLVRPIVIPPAGTARGILDKATGPVNPGDVEYTLGIDGSDSTWRMFVRPASGAPTGVESVTTISTSRTDMVVATRRDDRQRIFVNGNLEATVVPSDTGIFNDSALDLGFFQMAGGSPLLRAEAEVGMGVVWDRELTSSEIARLNSDPYRMWRSIHKDFMFGPGFVAAGQYQTFFLAF